MLTKLVKIRVFKDGNMIRVYHTPQNVIVKPKEMIVELYDSDGILTDSYHLVERILSWLEDSENDSSEILLDLKVKK